jgi:L-ribulose-5-phosphate 3-epimerase
MRAMRLGIELSVDQLAFNTVAWWWAKTEDVFRALAEIGYRTVELAAHPTALPPSSFTAQRAAVLRRKASDAGLKIAALNLTARYLLSETPFEPSFLALHSRQRRTRIELVQHGIEFAAALGAHLVVIASGNASSDVTRMAAMCHLMDGLEPCVELAKQIGVKIALKPLPFSLIDGYRAFLEVWNAFEGSTLGLCFDLASAHCVFEDIGAVIQDAPEIFHVHVADIRSRDMCHLIPGNGHIDFAPGLRALQQRGYEGAIAVNLPAHSLDPLRAARLARAKLLTIWPYNGVPQSAAELVAPCR